MSRVDFRVELELLTPGNRPSAAHDGLERDTDLPPTQGLVEEALEMVAGGRGSSREPFDGGIGSGGGAHPNVRELVLTPGEFET
jgi:hypothetical protein